METSSMLMWVPPLYSAVTPGSLPIILNTIKGKGVYFAENLVACHNMTITEEMWKKAVDMIDKEEI